MISVYIASTLLMLLQQELRIVPSAYIENRGFAFLERSRGPFENERVEAATFKNNASGEKIYLEVSARIHRYEIFLPNADKEQYDQSPISTYHPNAESGFPIGSAFRWIGDAGFYRVKVLGLYERVDGSIRYPGQTDGNGNLVRPSEAVTRVHRILLETSARYCLANLVSERLVTPSNMNVNGQVCQGYRERFSNERFLDMRSWASACNWQYRFNEDTATAILTKGNRTLIIPLGSRKIKVGGDWVETGDVVAFKNERMFVRHSFLQSQ